LSQLPLESLELGECPQFEGLRGEVPAALKKLGLPSTGDWLRDYSADWRNAVCTAGGEVFFDGFGRPYDNPMPDAEALRAPLDLGPPELALQPGFAEHAVWDPGTDGHVPAPETLAEAVNSVMRLVPEPLPRDWQEEAWTRQVSQLGGCDALRDLIHRHLTDAAYKRGGLAQVAKDMASSVAQIAKNPGSLEWANALASNTGSGCVNQPVQTWRRLSHALDIFEELDVMMLEWYIRRAYTCEFLTQWVAERIRSPEQPLRVGASVEIEAGNYVLSRLMGPGAAAQIVPYAATVAEQTLEDGSKVGVTSEFLAEGARVRDDCLAKPLPELVDWLARSEVFGDMCQHILKADIPQEYQAVNDRFDAAAEKAESTTTRDWDYKRRIEAVQLERAAALCDLAATHLKQKLGLESAREASPSLATTQFTGFAHAPAARPPSPGPSAGAALGL